MQDATIALVLDSDSAVPPFEQVRSQLVSLISDGSIAPGTRLPTVRSLATRLGIAANTVARSYRELESAGIIQTRGRNGSFVSSHGSIAQRQAQELAADYAANIRKLGITADHGLALVTSAIRALDHPLQLPR